jgi:hypothetical protein
MVERESEPHPEPESGDSYDWSYGTSVGDDAASQSDSHEALPLPKPGETFGPFELREEIGRGGMGAVYRALESRSGREVALKVVLDRGLDENRRKRFVREGELTANLKHPGIVRVHSAGDVAGTLYLAYELVQGAQTLTEAFENRRLKERVSLVRDAARALGFAHAAGVVHRDVKPDNVLVNDNGQVRVADFGLAGAKGLERLTETGAFVGTPLFMAPEQFDQRVAVGPHTDVWALGVILYFAATGELPFDGESLMDLAAQIIDCDPAPPQTLNKDVNADLASICGSALVTESTERYACGERLAADLDCYLAGEPIGATRRSQTGLGRIWRKLKRRSRYLPAALVALGVALIAATVGGIWTARRGDESKVVLAKGELRLRLRKLDQGTRQLLRSRTPLELDAALLRSLRDEHQSLGSMGLGAEPQANLAECGARLSALEGLRHLSLNEVEPARKRLEAVDPSTTPVAAAALRGALESLDAQTHADAAKSIADLTQAYDGGVARIEVRAWRAKAVLAAATLDRDLAEDGLKAMADLDRGGARLRGVLRLAEIRLCLALDRLGRATTALERLKAPPQGLEDRVRLAWIEVRLDEDDPAKALALAKQSPIMASEDRRRVLARSNAIASKLLAERATFDLDATMAALRLIRALDPDHQTSDEHVDALIDVIEITRNRDFDVVFAIADELAPNSYHAISQVARFSVRFGADTSKQMLYIVERAVTLAPSPAERDRMKIVLCEALRETGARRRCFKVADELLASTHLHASDRARVFRFRASTRPRNQPQQALDDLDTAKALGHPVELKQHLQRASLLLALGRNPEALREALIYAMEGPRSAKLNSAAVLVWNLSRALGEREGLVPMIERLLTVCPEFAGWRVRLAWALLADKRPTDAAASLVRAADAFEAGRVPLPADDPVTLRLELERLAPTLRTIAEQLRAGDPAASPALDQALRILEKMRRAGPWP